MSGEKLKTDWLPWVLVVMLMVGVGGLAWLSNHTKKEGDKGWARADVYRAQLQEARDRCAPAKDLWGQFDGCVVATAQLNNDLTACERKLAEPKPACPSPLTVQMQEAFSTCQVKLDEIQQRWDAKLRLAQEAIDKAKRLGVGPRLREWVGNAEAQMASREVFLSQQDWEEVDVERYRAADACRRQIGDLAYQTDEAKTLEEWVNRRRNGENPFEAQLEDMYPRFVRWRVMELELSRQSVGCKDTEE